MDAQASGLLAMACYNWGEKQVLPLVKSIPMPDNPTDRNFWKLLELHREKLIIAGTEDQVLVIYHADPGTASAEALALLGSITASSEIAQADSTTGGPSAESPWRRW